MPEQPFDMLKELNPNAVPADAPPAAANYREADVDGVSCASCAKFVFTGSDDGVIPKGYCSLYEANVRGDYVSDGFADPGPPLDEKGQEMWDFADGEREFNEVHLAGGETVEETASGYVVKEVLRTGEWPVIPTASGIMKKPLRIVRDGVSSPHEGIIAMSEVVANFQAGAIERPQIPLSDDNQDHKNLTRLNTGFVRDLWIEDKDGGSVLKAKMEFTEPEVKEKVLRGTYADVSCGIPWKIRSRGKEYGATLEHVCITNRPFIDGLGPFMAASDEQREEAEVVAYGDMPVEKVEFSEAQVIEAAEKIVKSFDGLTAATADNYRFEFADATLKISNAVAETTWTVPFEATAEGITLSDFSDWIVEEGETIEPTTESGSPSTPEFSEIDAARRLRELRLAQPSNVQRAKESVMPLISREELAALELSDDARAALQNVLDENARLTAQTREAEADRRVDELKALGLSDRPGALKFYRQVFLSDDDGPAVVLSDSDGTEKSRLSAREILDNFIEAVKGSDGKVNLSDQALASGNDNPPPANADHEVEKTVEDRLADARESLYGKTK